MLDYFSFLSLERSLAEPYGLELLVEMETSICKHTCSVRRSAKSVQGKSHSRGFIGASKIFNFEDLLLEILVR